MRTHRNIYRQVILPSGKIRKTESVEIQAEDMASVVRYFTRFGHRVYYYRKTTDGDYRVGIDRRLLRKKHSRRVSRGIRRSWFDI